MLHTFYLKNLIFFYFILGFMVSMKETILLQIYKLIYMIHLLIFTTTLLKLVLIMIYNELLIVFI